MPGLLPVESEWLSTSFAASPVGVDRENRVVKGYVVAELGDFKSRRGHFNERSLQGIVEVMSRNRLGTKTRLGHPTASGDSVSKQIGLARNPRLDTVTRETENGYESVPAVRADLHLLKSSFNPDGPNGAIGQWILDTLEEAPHVLSSSLVLRPKQEKRLDANGRELKDEDGEPLPPVWHPLAIHASDVVDVGDATSGMLSVEELPDGILRQGVELLNNQFAGQPRHVVEARVRAWLEKYLDHRYGVEDEPEPMLSGGHIEFLKRQLRLKRRGRAV